MWARRGLAATMRPTASFTAARTSSSQQMSQASPSGPCSAWSTMSTATSSVTAASIGDDDDLGRAGEARRHADQAAGCDLALGLGDASTSRADDDVDRPDRLGAVGERGDGSRTGDPVHLVDAGDGRGGQDAVVDRSVGARRGAEHRLGNAGDLRRDRGHERSGQQRRQRRRHVEAGPVDRATELTHDEAVALVAGGVVQLRPVIGGDVGVGDLECGPQLGRDAVGRTGHVSRGDPDLVDGDTVEAVGERTKRGVAVGADLFDDRPDLLDRRFFGRLGPGKHGAEGVGIRRVGAAQVQRRQGSTHAGEATGAMIRARSG